jgi:metal-responsive CopG/Arc/MetJ family transcriptional regulator
MRSVIVRLDDQLFNDFDALCREKGYAKQGLIKRLIRELVYTARAKALPSEKPDKDELEALREHASDEDHQGYIDWNKIKNEL